MKSSFFVDERLSGKNNQNTQTLSLFCLKAFTFIYLCIMYVAVNIAYLVLIVVGYNAGRKRT